MQVQWRLCQSSRVAYTQCQGGASLSHGASLSLATLLTITTGQFCLNEDRDDDKAILRYSFCPKGLLARSRAPTLPVQYIRVHLEKCILGWGGGELGLGSWSWSWGVGWGGSNWNSTHPLCFFPRPPLIMRDSDETVYTN